MKDVTEIDLPKENGEQNNAKEDKLLHFEVKVENRKVEGLITYSTDQQISKFKVNSATDQEVWGVYIDSQSNQNKWTKIAKLISEAKESDVSAKILAK